MKNKINTQKSKIALALGIFSGFVVLATLFKVMNANSTDAGVIIWAGILASMVAIILSIMDSAKSSSCNTNENG